MGSRCRRVRITPGVRNHDGGGDGIRATWGFIGSTLHACSEISQGASSSLGDSETGRHFPKIALALITSTPNRWLPFPPPVSGRSLLRRLLLRSGSPRRRNRRPISHRAVTSRSTPRHLLSPPRHLRAPRARHRRLQASRSRPRPNPRCPPRRRRSAKGKVSHQQMVISGAAQSLACGRVHLVRRTQTPPSRSEGGGGGEITRTTPQLSLPRPGKSAHALDRGSRAAQPGGLPLSAASMSADTASKLVGLATRVPFTNIDGVPLTCTFSPSLRSASTAGANLCSSSDFLTPPS